MNLFVKYMAIPCMLLCSSKAIAQGEWYTNTFAGLNFCNSHRDRAGYITGLATGVHLGSHFKCEGEFSYRQNGWEGFSKSVIYKEQPSELWKTAVK